MPQTLGEAAKAVGKNRTTLLRAVKAGKLSATYDNASGSWLIEPAELFRVYPPADADASPAQASAAMRSTSSSGEVRELRARLEAADHRFADAQDQIADLRHRLNRADEERRRAQEQLAGLQTQMAALLTDQRPAPASAPASAPPPPAPRRWWNWRRQG
jgi:septal ring factor EnvC (AmiA/AmiB activator)